MKVSPFIKTKNNTGNIMKHLLYALLLIISFAFFKNGIIPFMNNKVTILGMFYPLIFIGLGSLFTFLIETLYAYLILKKKQADLKEHIKTSYSVFPGLFLGLILPLNTPIYVLLFGCLMASIVGKLIFGGFGNNIFNPALVGYFFIIVVFGQTIMTAGYLNPLELDAITTSTPLSNQVEGLGTYDTLVSPYGDLSNFFFGTIPGAVGETGSIFILIALIYLLFFKVIKWEIPVIYILTVFSMIYLIGSINGLEIWYPLFQILSGGLLFGAVFMATDPVTSPTTPVGRVLFGLFLGILTVAIRYLTPYPDGVMLSILILNMFVFIFDKIGVAARFKFKKSIISFLVAWVLIMGLSIYIGNSYNTNGQTVDHNFNIVSKEVKEHETLYIVNQKGFSGIIKASIIISNDKVTKMEILEINDDYYSKLMKENYLKQLIKNQSNLEEVDTISGATISSLAIKNMLINTLKDYRGE